MRQGVLPGVGPKDVELGVGVHAALHLDEVAFQGAAVGEGEPQCAV
jgi:hypothetical protein